ncbi:S8 family peptidase [Longimicrobium sp.]|jgi:subtilisin family serine protease|uniref:S8 family peptidase n=1 Tax=Longimicrobium sp. TaxID=2029185 RepID=UPI002ED98F60
MNRKLLVLAPLALAACVDTQAPMMPGAESAAPSLSAAPAQEFVPGEVIVKFRAGASSEARGAALQRMNATVRERIVTNAMRRNGDAEGLTVVHSGLGTTAAIDRLRGNPNVEYAEPNWIYRHNATSNDTYFTNGSLWGMYGDASSPANQYGSQAAEAWAANHTGSRTVYVGIIDEGIQFSHPDLDANIWLNPFDPADGVDNDGNGYVDDQRGWDFANGDNGIYDGGTRGSLDKHGTHVAGTIGGEGGNGVGVAGVNWNVTMISGKFLGRSGGTTTNAIKAVDYFTDLKKRHGLNIVATNNSWGGGGFSQALLDAINRGGSAGILFIAAAGNGGSDGVGDNNDAVASYPSNYLCTANGSYDCVIAVASTTSSGGRSSFSNYGATTVDIGAPGSGIYSTLPANTYGSYSGTSMATPHVSGAAALYASTHSGATAAQIRSAILSSAVPTASLSGITVTGGRLNVSGF